MRFGSMIATAGIIAMLGASAAQAAPVATLQTAIQAGPAPQLELVRGGCGFGMHRSYYGHCHFNAGWRGRWRYYHG